MTVNYRDRESTIAGVKIFFHLRAIIQKLYFLQCEIHMPLNSPSPYWLKRKKVNKCQIYIFKLQRFWNLLSQAVNISIFGVFNFCWQFDDGAPHQLGYENISLVALAWCEFLIIIIIIDIIILLILIIIIILYYKLLQQGSVRETETRRGTGDALAYRENMKWRLINKLGGKSLDFSWMQRAMHL